MEQVLFEIKNLKSLIEEQNILQKKVLTFKEAAKFIDVSESHLYLLTSKSLIPHYKPNKGRLYFRRNELETWLTRNKVKSDSEIDIMAENHLDKIGRGVKW